MPTTTSSYDGLTLEWRIVDNGDGTGTRTTFHLDGTINTVEQLTGLPIPPPDQVTADVDAAAALAAMSTALAPLTGTSTSAQQRAALLALRAAISDALGE